VGLALLVNHHVRRAAELEHLAALGKMSAVLAHEIRNPLGTIKGFAQLLAEKGDGELVAPILSETSRMEDLVKDLLLYGRPPEPAMRRMSAAVVAEAMERHARHAVRGRGVRYESQMMEVEFETDAAMLEQALLNLLRNAVEATPDGGRVAFQISADARWVRFTIFDSGSGFSPEARARMFEPFFTTKASGTGLGLSITRKLAQALGGELTISSEGGGKAELRIPR
jgi:two-component system sensor histidine kinase HydH